MPTVPLRTKKALRRPLGINPPHGRVVREFQGWADPASFNLNKMRDCASFSRWDLKPKLKHRLLKLFGCLTSESKLPRSVLRSKPHP